jgi:Tol biopolymer transport system component
VRFGNKDRPSRAHHLAWSPDGKQLAFLADAGNQGQMQLQLASASGQSPRRLTSVKGERGTPRWSHDGKAIAFLFTENARAAAGPVAAKPAETGVIGESMDVQRLAVADAASGTVRTVSTPELYVHEYDWSPDGRTWVATAAPPPGDDGWYHAKLYAIDTATGEAKVLFAPTTAIGRPRVSPDGRTVAFIAGLMSDEGPVGGEIFVMSGPGRSAAGPPSPV